MIEPVSVIPLVGFDVNGEPEIRVMADGSLYLVFNFMPPSWAEDDSAFDDFDQQLAQAVGLPVVWEDREFFRIERPANATVERIRRFVAKRFLRLIGCDWRQLGCTGFNAILG